MHFDSKVEAGNHRCLRVGETGAHVQSSTWSRGEMAALIGRAGTQAGWTPRPQLPQESAAPNLGADGEPEQSLQQWWCGGLGRRVQRWCFQQSLNHLRKERLHLSPHKTVGTSCLGVTGHVFGSLITKPIRNRAHFFFLIFISKC